MSDPSRRGFLKVAGAGVAAAGVAGVVAAGAAAASQTGDPGAGTASAAPASPPSGPSEILAHVHDVHTGAISLLVEGHEITVTDPDLAVRIAAALHHGTRLTV